MADAPEAERKVVLKEGLYDFPFAVGAKIPSFLSDTLDGSNPTLRTIRKVFTMAVGQAFASRESWIVEGIRAHMTDLQGKGASQTIAIDALAVALWIVYNDLSLAAGSEASDGEMRGMFWSVLTVEESNTAIFRMELAGKDHFLHQEMMDGKPSDTLFLFLTDKASKEEVWVIVGMEMLLALKSMFIDLFTELPDEKPESESEPQSP